MPSKKDYYRNLEKSRAQGRKDAALYRYRYPERAKASSASSYKKNINKRKKEQAAYRRKNRVEIKEKRSQYYTKNRKKLRKKMIKYSLEHRKETRIRNAKNYLLNKEKIKRNAALYQKEHPEKTKAFRATRRTRLTKAGGSFTAAEWKALCKQCHNRCLCCGKRRKLTADHVIPVSKGGSSNIENIQPLCQPCNSSKGNKTIDYRRRTQ
jgi:5-methylcytosine-specific restriction endonuclease McrA